ncbi:MAG: FtsQ-type POTRA domain-containing protein [Solobacterium sp.]|nr:FtsQ-type POTRA domain-containing protein [Solobacterium sp.]
MALNGPSLDDFRLPEHGVTALLKEKQNEKDNSAFEKSKPLLFRIAVFIAVVILGIVWYVLPSSRVKIISVNGNNYLPADYIKTISGVTEKNRYYLVLPFRVASKVEEDPLIRSCSVRLLPQNIIRITVEEEEPLGYRYTDQGPVILLGNEQIVQMTSEYLPIIGRLPYIEGFEEEDQTRKLITALKKIDRLMLEEITEIRQYPLSYDPEAMELQMRDGSYFFTNYYSVEAVNSYHDIYVRMNDHSQCIYADTSADRAYSGVCPWNYVPVEHEYWTDENGNLLYNQYGDPAVKHYYTDNQGHYYLDDAGNRIAVPLNEYNADVYDSEFLDHYLNGYYATGVLIIPPEPEPVPEEEVPEEEAEY